jgi:hypothetical protein
VFIVAFGAWKGSTIEGTRQSGRDLMPTPDMQGTLDNAVTRVQQIWTGLWRGPDYQEFTVEPYAVSKRGVLRLMRSHRDEW